MGPGVMGPGVVGATAVAKDAEELAGAHTFEA